MAHEIDPELREWARTAFRPVHLEGLNEAKAARAVRIVGAEHLSAHDPHTQPLTRAPLFGVDAKTVLIGAGLFGAAFLVGRWWKKRQPKKAPALGLVPEMPGLRLVPPGAIELPAWAV